MLLVCQEKIKEEIKFADFFSVIADETTDVSLTFQLAIVFRYVLPNGEPVERFWGFIHPTGHDSDSVSYTHLDVYKRQR